MISNAGKISQKHRRTSVGLSNPALPGKKDQDYAIRLARDDR